MIMRAQPKFGFLSLPKGGGRKHWKGKFKTQWVANFLEVKLIKHAQIENL